MEKEDPLRPLKALIEFIANTSDVMREWLGICCAFVIEENPPDIRNADEASAWFRAYLTGGNRPERQFGRLITLIGVLDFELSPFAASRFEARAQHMTEADGEWIASEGRRTLQERAPQLRALVDAWRDVRTHELDEASLWVHRDEARRLGMEETAMQIESLHWPFQDPP